MANKDRLNLKAKKKAVDTTPVSGHAVKDDAKVAGGKAVDDGKAGARKGGSHAKSTGHQATSKKR
jgi:hypothetical protein